MSDLVIHTRRSLILGPMGDISVHASITTHYTILDKSNNLGARYVPQNIVSITVHDTSLKIVHPL